MTTTSSDHDVDKKTKMNSIGDYSVFCAEIPKGADVRKVGISFKYRNGFLFKSQKSLYGKFSIGEKSYKIMIVPNKFKEGNTVPVDPFENQGHGASDDESYNF